ncbi:MAG: response regulator [Firmicutes bacterium]|nr:response regulator [Bacillota bacterium]
MIIFALDDEMLLLQSAQRVIQEAVPQADVRAFSRAKDALEQIETEGVCPDAVFCDIEMPGMDGLAFAVRVKEACPNTRIIFVTGYTEYAVEAYRMHVHGYVMKPLKPERVREELENSIPEPVPVEGKLQVRCFGYFEVYWANEPLTFARSKTKELLAFLIDREGAICTAEEILTALWEDELDLKKGKDRIRHLIQDLKRTLSQIGMEQILIRRSGRLAIRRESIDCDYYRMLDGDVAAVNAYYGEYMNQYSWAEISHGRLSHWIRTKEADSAMPSKQRS